MGFELLSEPPSLRVTAPDGHIVLDTNERPALITDYIEGVVSKPLRDTPLYSRTTTLLGQCAPGSSFTIAMLRFTTLVPGQPPSVSRWYNMSGTLSQNLGGISTYTANTTVLLRSVVIDGANINFVEDVQARRVPLFPGSPQWIPVYGYNADYRIWVGRFHG